MKKLIYIEALRLMQNQTMFKVIGFNESQRNRRETGLVAPDGNRVYSHRQFDIAEGGSLIYLPGGNTARNEFPVLLAGEVDISLIKLNIRNWEKKGGFEGVAESLEMSHFLSISDMNHQVVHLSNLSFEYLGGKDNFFIIRLIRIRRYYMQNGIVFQCETNQELGHSSTTSIRLAQGANGGVCYFDRGWSILDLSLSCSVSSYYQSVPFSQCAFLNGSVDIFVVDTFNWVMNRMQEINQKMKSSSPLVTLCDPIDPTSGEIF